MATGDSQRGSHNSLHAERLVHGALQGNLSEFVKIRPEAKAYYELGSASLKFILPKPGFLDGIKGREVWCSR